MLASTMALELPIGQVMQLVVEPAVHMQACMEQVALVAWKANAHMEQGAPEAWKVNARMEQAALGPPLLQGL